MKPKAYSYIRFSSKAQAKGDSLRRQLEDSKAYAESNGYVLDDSLIHKDLGLSAFDGSNLKKGALGAFLKLVEDGQISKGSCLIVESLDRISRAEILTAFSLFSDLLNSGIRVVTLADGMEYTKQSVTNNVGELFISLTLMSRAHEESAIKSRRLKKSWEQKRKDIKEKKLTAKCPHWLNLNSDRTEYVVIKERANIVNRIFQMSVDGYGKNAIATELNKRNIKSWGRSNGWHTSYIDKILKSRAVLGEFQPHKMVNKKQVPDGDLVEDYFPKVVTRDLFFQAQKAIKSRSRRGGVKGEVVAGLFPGLLKCGYCGTSMRNRRKGPGREKYIVCDAAHRGIRCIKKTWNYYVLEESFMHHTINTDFSKVLGGDVANEKVKLTSDIDTLKAEIDDIESRVENLIKLAESGDDIRAVRDKIDKHQSRLDDLRLQVKVKESALDSLSGVLQKQNEGKEVVKELLKVGSSADKQKIIDTRLKVSQAIMNVVDKIEVFTDGRKSPVTSKALAKDMVSKYGFSEDEVSAYLSSKGRGLEEPYYVTWYKDGGYQVVVPDPDTPKKYKTIANREYAVLSSDADPNPSLSEAEMNKVLGAEIDSPDPE